MSEIKWIKITTGMFQDEKIDYIESLPEADAILIIWIKLLTLAGKCNSNGFIFLTENIPYTYEMLAHKFRRPINVVKLALQTFNNLEMIVLDGDFIKIANWEKHQNIEGMEKIKEQTRKRVANYRERQKNLLPAPCSNATCNATVTQGNETDIDIDKELDIDIDKELDIEIDKDIEIEKISKLSKDNLTSIIHKWNSLNLSQIKAIKPNTLRYKMLKSRINEYGLEEVLRAIDNIKESSFLRGQSKTPFIITLDWLVKPNNFSKVLDGNYKDNVKKSDFKKNNQNLQGAYVSASNNDLEDMLIKKRENKAI